MFEKFAEWAKKNKWNIVEGNKSLPSEILQRYRYLPESWLSFIEGYSQITNEENNIWFLTADNYYPKDEDEWRYNEFELISIDATDGDEELLADVKSFWDNHIPIVMSAANGYEYYAIELDSGNVVNGFEPEFEEAEIIAESFDEFINMVINDEIFYSEE